MIFMLLCLPISTPQPIFGAFYRNQIPTSQGPSLHFYAPSPTEKVVAKYWSLPPLARAKMSACLLPLQPPANAREAAAAAMWCGISGGVEQVKSAS
jgi:hypothetical protein